MTSDDSMYRAPESALERPTEGTARSLDDAIAGDFELDLGAILQEAWDKTTGSKGVILAAAGITFAVNMAGSFVSALLTNPENAVMATTVSLLISLGTMGFNYAINAGSYLYCIKWVAGDASAGFDDIFSCLPMIGPIFGLMALYVILSGIGLMLLIVPGIYLGVGYVFALPLKAERNLGVWEALETSRKAVHNDWFKVLAILLVAGVGLTIGAVFTLGIALIWLLPWASLVFAITYREMFGYAGRA